MIKKWLPIILLFLCVSLCIGAYYIIMANSDATIELFDIYCATSREEALNGLLIKGSITDTYYRNDFTIESDGIVKKELKQMPLSKYYTGEYNQEPFISFQWSNLNEYSQSLIFSFHYHDHSKFLFRDVYVNTGIRLTKNDMNTNIQDIHDIYQDDIYFTTPFLSNKKENGIFYIQNYKQLLGISNESDMEIKDNYTGLLTAIERKTINADQLVTFDQEEQLTVHDLKIINDRIIVIFYKEDTIHINTYTLNGTLINKVIENTSRKIEQINTYFFEENLIIILPYENNYRIYRFTCNSELGCQLNMVADAKESLIVNKPYKGRSINHFSYFQPILIDDRLAVIAWGNLVDENSKYTTYQPYIHVFSKNELIYCGSIVNDIYEDRAYHFENSMIEQARQSSRYISAILERKETIND